MNPTNPTVYVYGDMGQFGFRTESKELETALWEAGFLRKLAADNLDRVPINEDGSLQVYILKHDSPVKQTHSVNLNGRNLTINVDFSEIAPAPEKTESKTNQDQKTTNQRTQSKCYTNCRLNGVCTQGA